MKCPLAFRLKYVDGLPSRATPSLFVGKRVHAALEYFYRHLQRNEYLAAHVVASYITRSWDEAVAREGIEFSTPAEAARLQGQTINLVTAYLAHLAAAPEPRPSAVEARLKAREGSND